MLQSGDFEDTEDQNLAEMQPPLAALDMALDPGAAAQGQQAAANLPDNSGINFNGSWIEWFCSLEGHDFLSIVPRAYLLDKFNWLEIRSLLKLSKQRYEESRNIVLSLQAPTQADLENENFLQLNQDASDMYGLVHARYISSAEGKRPDSRFHVTDLRIFCLGLAVIYGKFLKGGYGHCPRALCDNMSVLPIGMNDQLRKSRVKVFCHKCEEVYIPNNLSQSRSVALDGAYFGTSIAHVFLQMYSKSVTLPPCVYFYEPKLFGFKVAGKRGSMYYTPCKENVSDTREVEKAFKESIQVSMNCGPRLKPTERVGLGDKACNQVNFL